MNRANVYASIFMALGFLVACAPTPVLKEQPEKLVTKMISLPETGVIHSKRIGQTILSQTTTRRSEKKVAIMTDGFQQAASFSSSGYSIDIPAGAKGLLIDNFSACFNNRGLNAGIYGSKGKTNFCFYDTNRDGLFDKAMLDSYNSWGNFVIAPTRFLIEDVIVGAGDILKKRELLYKAAGIIEYREFSQDNPTTPKVIETIRFSTANGDTPTIRHRGAKLSVNSATNDEIRFEVLSHFDSK